MHRDREMCHRNVSQRELRKRRKKLALRNEKWGDPEEEEEKAWGQKHERKGLCSETGTFTSCVYSYTANAGMFVEGRKNGWVNG